MTVSLGLIAGAGELAPIFVREARKTGRKVVAVTFDKESEKLMAGEADEVYRLALGQAGKVFKTFHGADVTEVAMIGKIDKRAIFKNPKFDMRAISILAKMKTKNDDTFMLTIVSELEKEGFKVINQTEILKALMPGKGHLSKRKPTDDELADIEFGMKMAKGVADLDIGQTVIVKKRAILAVEAIDGTDETIKRGGEIAGKGAVVCKVSKPHQDQRFDVPAVGENTIKTMVAHNVGVLAIEAGKTVVVNEDKMSRLCDKHKIVFVAL